MDAESRALDYAQKAKTAPAREALQHAIAAAELYMQAFKTASASHDRTRLSRRCREMVDLAEKLKLLSQNPDPPGPRCTRQLSKDEKSVISNASWIHGHAFPPWEAPPAPSSFAKDGDDMYLDSFPYTFSPTQMGLFTGWKRPSELLSRSGLSSPEALPDSLMVAGSDSDLVQDLLTDCSVVASLSASMRHLCRKQGSLLSSLMYPFDQKNSRPAISPNGKYIFRMLFNGCFREVTIDDRLPSSSPSRALFVVDQRNPELIWPALMEKAYLKIRGGYDFPGSNSGTDLYVLTGWIPEQRFLRHDESDLGHSWGEMKRAYDAGNVVLTLGTSYLSPEEEETLGLVSEHDYAVMDLDDHAGVRRMLVKNPWRNSVVWKGVGSSASIDVIASSPSLPAESAGAGGGTGGSQTGTFWMPFDDVVQNFDSLYLNWNPTLFAYRQDHHFRWELPRKVDANALWHNPQFSLRSPTSEPIWVLLSRHWKDSELEILRNERRSDREGRVGADSDSSSPAGPTLASVSKALGFISLSVYATSCPPGSRVYLPDCTPLHRSTYVDSPNTLVRIDRPDPRKTYTVVVTQAGLPLPEYSFTLSFFSAAPLAIGPAPNPLSYITLERGDWTRRTAGGNIESPTYHTNPQFALTVPPSAGAGAGTRLYLALTTDADDLPIHVALLHSAGGRRVTSASNRRRDVIASSPEYRRGAVSASTFSPNTVTSSDIASSFSSLSVSPSPSSSFPSSSPPSPSSLVPPGTYTIVASTFEPGQLARFRLAIMADAPVSVRPVFSDAAGRFTYTLGPLPRGPACCRAPISPSRLTRMHIVVRRASAAAADHDDLLAGGSGSAGAVRVSLELGQGPDRTVLAVTGEGEFADVPPAGLRTRDVDVERRDGGGGEGGGASRRRAGLWVVVERIGGLAISSPGGGIVEVDLLSDASLAVGGWECED